MRDETREPRALRGGAREPRLGTELYEGMRAERAGLNAKGIENGQASSRKAGFQIQ
jgi:hypothetical protein